MVKQSPVAVAGVAWPDARWDQLAAEALARCDALARCSDDGQRIHRLFCSPAMSDAHRLASQWLTEAGLALRVDAAANLVGRWESPGCDPRRRLILGSHLDTVIDAGRYDGVLGVVLGIAVASALAEIGARLPWALEVYGFSDEEGVRFGVPFLGSRALAGTLDAALLRLCDPAGTSMAQALRDFGVDPLETPRVAASGDVVGYIEAHIEQGPLLEMIGAPLGVATAIAGQTRLTAEWTGDGGHAGTAPMAERQDALLAAARWALAVEQLARSTPGMVATVGRLQVEPNVPNCIPRRVRASLDLRHHEDAVRAEAAARLVELAEQLARDSHLAIRIEYDHQHAAIAMDAALADALAETVAAAGYQPQRMVSGAGHDAGVVAAVAPTALLMVRSPGGVSHHPDEAVTRDDVAAALRVLVALVLRLADA